jgi:toxin ParE1/3/4
MAVYRLSSKATADLDQIHEYLILNFGLKQAQAYLSGFYERFGTLAENPTYGRSASELSPGLRRSEYQAVERQVSSRESLAA